MNRERCEANQERLLRELPEYLAANNIAAADPGSKAAERLAQGISLAQSRGDASFADLCTVGGRLRSPGALAAEGIKPLKADGAEVTLGTEDFVFLYAAPFSFPNSCGLLFAPALERLHRDTGYATPFDSGGLVRIFQRPDMSEPPREFFARHELPLPEHRQYLERCLESLFGAPRDYLEGQTPRYASPIGLTGGDWRRWTHEVRVPHELVVRTPYLQAIFFPRRLGLVPEVTSMVRWCESEGFDVIPYDADRENEFANLRRSCVEYLRAKCL